MNIFWFVLVLMVLVLVHEAGHMVVAKWCGMRVERFSIFFGRPLWSFRRGETEYGIGWLPLGGYVKISGMTRDEEIPPELRHRAYYNAATWKKVATIFAGPAVNIVLAFVVFSSVYWVGVPTPLPTTTVAVVNQDSPAAAIGLEPGDRLLSVDGVAAEGESQRIRAELQERPGEIVSVRYLRDGAVVERETRLEAIETDQGTVGQLGFSFAVERGPVQRFGPVDGLVEGGRFTWLVIDANVDAIGQIFVSEEAREQINSVVGIGAVFNEVSDDGLMLLRLIGLISLALGIFNLLPFLPLDGGHILFALIERVRGAHLSASVYGKASLVGIIVLMLVFFVALQNDIGRINGEGFGIER